MNSIMELCFLCTKDHNCVPVDDKIVSQVEYVLPEITITKLGIPLRICSVCYEALYTFSKFKQFCMESSRRLETRIKGAQASGALDPPQTQLPPDRASEIIQLHIDTNSNNAEEIVIKAEKQEETLILESCSSILKNILLEHCSSREHNTEGGSAAPDTSATSVDKSEMIEEIFIKEEPLEDSPEDMNTYETNCATLNTSEPSHTKPQLNETIFIKEEHMEIQPETITNSTNVFKSTLDQNDKDNQIEQHTSAESATLDTSEMWEGSSEDSETETEMDNQTSYSGKKKYQCDICSKKFSKKSNFDRHMKTLLHSGKKKFVCKICKKPFSRKDNLATHMTIHSGVKDFHCDVCNKSFMQYGTLANHMKIHSGIKEFQCDLCNKSFTRKSDVVRHKKIHSGVKDFQCDLCSKSFRQKFNLVAHMKFHSDIKDSIS